MDVSIDYDTPEKQPDIVGCRLLNISIDPVNGTWSGTCQRSDGAGVQSNFIVLDAPIDMGDMGTIIDILVAAAQNTKPPQIAPGKVIIK
jgi:hypothetical protein